MINHLQKLLAEPLEKGYGLNSWKFIKKNTFIINKRYSCNIYSNRWCILHEFTSIKGVREDVTDIVLNVKSLALKSTSDEQKN